MKLENSHIFFCGIGGIGMSGLAKVLALSGYRVSGSDLSKSNITRKLERLGIKIYSPQKKDNLNGVDVFVYSAAIPCNNPEFIEAKRKGIKLLSRSELLGCLMNEKKGIAVAGTHGKTTTSTMLSLVLEESGLDPTIVIGGEVKNIGGNAKKGNGPYFVAEACEYERSFLDLKPFGAIITNIEADHLDTYDSLADILESFKKFTSKIDEKGFLTICSEDKNLMSLNGSYQGTVLTYGFSKAKYIAGGIKVMGHKTVFDVYKEDQKIGKFKLIIPGRHNILNALSVIATCDYLGIDIHSIKKTLALFTGAKRRFEIKGKKNGVLVIDDYAHHPTEIQATLSGIAEYYPQKRIWAVFQPHQYSRTKFLFLEFANSFTKAYKVIVPDIYAARDTEEDKKSISSKMLADKIQKISSNGIYVGDFEGVAKYLKQNTAPGDLIVTLGAGPVFSVGEIYLEG